MKARTPTWELRAPCPCCEQAGLVFTACTSCHRVALVCAEVGTVFDDPRDLSRSLPPSPRCTCGGELADATSEQIQALGFTPDDCD